MPVPADRPRPQAIFPRQRRNHPVRKRFGVALALAGVLIFILGAEPSWFGMDRSPVTGFVQIAVFLIGLAFICIGGYVALISLWNGEQLTIVADIGSRLVSTGYVVAVASGMADVFGFGSEALPRIPTFGIWQQRGVLFGELVIASGFLLMIRWDFSNRPPDISENNSEK
ncbi:MAG TPA: hypothetical protein VI451_22385 [Anaerolineales bacterium]|nr:hypothetical protein [Anaerolineales bacterium]